MKLAASEKESKSKTITHQRKANMKRRKPKKSLKKRSQRRRNQKKMMNSYT